MLLSKVGILLGALLNKSVTNLSVDSHIEAGMKWLSTAQDATADDGVAIRYSLFRGWESSYPETTGYIIPTFLKYYTITGDSSYKERAMRMAEWELSIQQKDGSFVGGAFGKGVGKLVFDTGQIIFGFLSAFEHFQEEKFLEAARMAGDWLISVQDDDGAWRKFSYNSIHHTYHSRVAWSIVKLYNLTGEKKYYQAAIKHIDWVLSNQEANGWFRNAGFTAENNNSPYTHTIAYTIRGLLEVGILLNMLQYIDAARQTVDAILGVMNPEGFLWGRFKKNWTKKKRFSCLTGNAQISIICSKLYGITKDSQYIKGARSLNEYLRSKQNLTTNNKNVRGAIPGSFPMWGEYERFSYPNWATKFFVDALTLEKEYNTI